MRILLLLFGVGSLLWRPIICGGRNGLILLIWLVIYFLRADFSQLE
jgi:hypothetical protein